MDNNKFTPLSGDEAANIIGARGGFLCWLSGGAIALSLLSMNPVAIVASVASADLSC
jgi:hypothetical protein